jgi:hypothetical protein
MFNLDSCNWKIISFTKIVTRFTSIADNFLTAISPHCTGITHRSKPQIPPAHTTHDMLNYCCRPNYLLELIFFNRNILLKLSCTALSGVLAPLVTPIITSLSCFSISSINFSVTISPDMVRCVMVLSAPIQEAVLMWKERTPAFWGISRRWAVFEESHPPTTRMKSSFSSSAFSTRSWIASCRSFARKINAMHEFN